MKSGIIERTMTALSYLTCVLALFCFVPQLDAAGCIDKVQGNFDCDPYCNQRVICSGPGYWTNVTNCLSTGQICYDEACVSSTNEYCTGNYPDMMCNNQEGMFAFPSDCTSYFTCTSEDGVGQARKCVGSRFDPLLRTCSLPLTNGGCPASTTVSCTSAQKLAVPGTDTYYYQCYQTANGFGMILIKCPSGQRYSTRTGDCEDVGSISESSTVCGNSSVGPQPHGSSSCSYIWCYSQTEFVVRDCTRGWHYDHSQRSCVYGGCP